MFWLVFRPTLQCLIHAVRDHCCRLLFWKLNIARVIFRTWHARPLISSSSADNKHLGSRRKKTKTLKWEVSESFPAQLPAGDSFLARSEMWNCNPRGEAKCSEHIVSAQMWTHRWTRSHRSSSANTTPLCPLHLKTTVNPIRGLQLHREPPKAPQTWAEGERKFLSVQLTPSLF